MSAENVTIEQVPKGRLAIWLLVAGELIIFGGFIACYLLARFEYGGAFPAAMMDGDQPIILWYWGAINTTILLASSWSIVKAHEAAMNNELSKIKMFSLVTIALAAVFLFIKFYFEWSHDFHLGASLRSFDWLPTEYGAIAADGGLQSVKTLFWSYYFIMTGFHGLHVVIGALAIFIVMLSASKGKNLHRVELAGMYWHMVDLIWIFLFPMFYLAQ
ncbi:MAG: cytochrome c oxidase subunit 3 [Leptospirales bacterium]